MTNSITFQYFKSPVGELIVGAMDGQLCICDWRYRKMRKTIDARIQKHFDAAFIEAPHPVIAATVKQLEEYFAQTRKAFEMPILYAGSDFQKCVWDALAKIPFGEVNTYKQLADKIGKPEAIRAVANANGANAISIIVPCHRVVGSNGKLVGYAGGLKAKETLLGLESDLFAK